MRNTFVRVHLGQCCGILERPTQLLYPLEVGAVEEVPDTQVQAEVPDAQLGDQLLRVADTQR